MATINLSADRFWSFLMQSIRKQGLGSCILIFSQQRENWDTRKPFPTKWWRGISIGNIPLWLVIFGLFIRSCWERLKRKTCKTRMASTSGRLETFLSCYLSFKWLINVCYTSHNWHICTIRKPDSTCISSRFWNRDEMINKFAQRRPI